MDKMYRSQKGYWDVEELAGQINHEVSITLDQLAPIKQKTKGNKQALEQEIKAIFTSIAFIKCNDPRKDMSEGTNQNGQFRMIVF